MDPQDQNQNPTDDQGGSTPTDVGQTGGGQPIVGGEEPQVPPTTEPSAEGEEGEGEIAPPPPAAEEPGAETPSEQPTG